MATMDEIYSRWEEPCVRVDRRLSEVRRFYEGQVILVTGATGFVGKTVVEKLLRGCPELKRLYLLIRRKKQDPETRMKQYFDNVLFQRMKRETPNWRDKVVLVNGDCTAAGLGIAEDQRRVLIDEVNVVFHMAANVKFTEGLSSIFKINVLGTQEALNLAKDCRRLKCFLYVSTAFSHCYRYECEEKYYPTPIDIGDVHELIRKDESPEGIEKELFDRVVGKWPNTYVLSKAIAENLVRDYARDMPVGIFRPSVVTAAYQEPLTSWVESSNGAALAFSFAALGYLHVLLLDMENVVDFIPADMCANAILVTAWDVAKTYPVESRQAPIYNYTSSVENPIRWKQFETACIRYSIYYPPAKTVWYYYVVTTSNQTLFKIGDYVAHYIPALLLDTVLALRGKPRRVVAMYNKTHDLHKILNYFMTSQWRFHADNSRHLWDKLNAADRKLFFCDLRELSWDLYCYTYWRGLRRYCLNDPFDTLKAAQRRHRRLYVLHSATKFFFVLLFACAFLRLFLALF